MGWFELIVLAVVQGITEFLPISSSAHLILVPALTGWPDQGLAIDVAMHIGTLAAVMLYFHRETAAMVQGGFQLLRGNTQTSDARLALQVALATMPVVLAGFALASTVATDWRDPLLIAVTTIGFGVLLWVADRSVAAQTGLAFDRMTLRVAVLIGLAQALALVPGVSRSGITMTAALLLGFRREAAARFSLLLSIPTTAAAGTMAGVDLWQSGDAALQGDAIIAAGFSFIAALLAIAFLMSWLRRATFMPFVVYRLILGVFLLVWIYV
ncbi:undecaprenyl-diphosphate phosphatase [Thalassobaculum sp. OXR-137]|uniref:undecaprenyl-diphosphate phosphatase n=1 Tax=Thalassobaculum sp. OXR-137 TaxID=3100173 RepID=UPI002AC95198|nr:undecaprenyl-diphosphate phosphatase [Thalassobaculum sp. OXR-137]WPZ34084.1 undecaprenyl-diphosphate phosphatase [Thalassobaculum sp. OXR-137]